ncbi:hypothetical protein F2Q68_00003832 [Brassica cretica]|uniref:Uncharacterized protein n=1 Tax=Brassica cretica TaxID=69181 RepID=A0A8S9JML0_BRACR|nr:hypothetical protein F2Q68_00003832 [Brassica cretica]
MEKNKPKNGSKSSPFKFSKRGADGLDETGKNKKNLERKTRKLNPSTTAYAQGLQRFCTKHKIKLSNIYHVFLHLKARTQSLAYDQRGRGKDYGRAVIWWR